MRSMRLINQQQHIVRMGQSRDISKLRGHTIVGRRYKKYRPGLRVLPNGRGYHRERHAHRYAQAFMDRRLHIDGPGPGQNDTTHD